MTADKLEIIFCTDGIFPHAIGGMQRHSRLLIEELAKDINLKIIVIHPHAGTKIFDEHFSIEEIAVAPGKSSGKYLVDCYRYSKKVYEVLLRFPDALIYSQGLSVWHKISEIGKRVIINPHGLESFQTLSWKDKLTSTPFRMIFRYLFSKSVNVVSLGGKLTGILHQLTGDSENNKIVVLPNAVNIPVKQNKNYDHVPIQFLFVGRFAFNKGIGILLEAVKQLNDEGFQDKMTFNLVGKGPLFDEYKRKYAASNINFLGFADDNKLTEMYRTNDVFVLPTLFEGMPTVVLEAMCYCMPIIVTDVGATLELVDSSNGYIIEKKNVNSLKKALLNYFKLDVVERKLLGECSYLKVKDNFTWSVVAEKHKKLFYNLKKVSLSETHKVENGIDK